MSPGPVCSVCSSAQNCFKLVSVMLVRAITLLWRPSNRNYVGGAPEQPGTSAEWTRNRQAELFRTPRAFFRIQWNTGEAGVESLLSPTFSCHTHQPVRGGVARDTINGSWASNRHRRLQSTVLSRDGRCTIAVLDIPTRYSSLYQCSPQISSN